MKVRWAESKWWRLGLITALLVAAILTLAIVSRLTGAPVSPAVTPTADPTAGPTAEPTGTATTPTGTPVPTTSPAPTSESDAKPLPQLPDTDNPDEYAVAVAEIVLGLNPRDYGRQEYLDLLLRALGDFEADARERIEPVIEAWLPDDYQWQRQRDYGQVHTFKAENVWVPQIAQENADQLRGVYEIRTIAGTQTTRFLDENNDQATTTTPRLITVIAYCPGTTCSLVSIPQEVQR